MTTRRLQIAMIVLAVLGIIDATYLTIVHANGHEALCVAHSHGCATVADSRYAHLGSLRVSALGIIGYAVMLVLAFAFRRSVIARSMALMVSLVAVIFSGYLTYLELSVIHAICQWCVGSAVISCLLLIVTSAAIWHEERVR